MNKKDGADGVMIIIGVVLFLYGMTQPPERSGLIWLVFVVGGLGVALYGAIRIGTR